MRDYTFSPLVSPIINEGGTGVDPLPPEIEDEVDEIVRIPTDGTKTISGGAQEAYDAQQADPTKRVLVYVPAGTFKETDICRQDVDMYFEDGAVVWNNASATPVISDNDASFTGVAQGERRCRIFGKGSFHQLLANPFNDEDAVNLRNGANFYIQAKSVGTSQQWSDPNSFIRYVDCEMRWYSEANNVSQKIYDNCTFTNPVTAAAGGAGISGVIFNNCEFTLKPDYTFATFDPSLYVVPTVDGVVVEYGDLQAAGVSCMVAYKDGFTDQATMLAAHVQGDTDQNRPQYLSCVQMGFRSGGSAAQYRFFNCTFRIQRPFCAGVLLAVDEDKADQLAYFDNCFITDETGGQDTTNLVAGFIAPATAGIPVNAEKLYGNAVNNRGTLTGYTDTTTNTGTGGGVIP